MKILINNLEETTNELKRFINNSESFITGSFKWGVNNDLSDIDVVFPPHCGITFADVIASHNGKHLSCEYAEEEFDSCYVKYDGQLINLLFMYYRKYYDKWKFATDAMTEIINQFDIMKKVIRDKKIRISIFEALKEQYNITKGD